MSLSRLVIASTACVALSFGISSDAQAQRRLNVCVVYNNALTLVPATYSGETGDTLVQGRRFSAVHPLHTGYASRHTWYINNEAITVGDGVYSKYGLPRVLGISEVARIGMMSGVGVYAEAGATAPEVIYLPVRTGCEFQPYTPAGGDAIAKAADAAISRRDYATAHRLLTRPAAASNGHALTLRGELLHFGYGVAKDTAAARTLYDQAIAAKAAGGYTGRGLLAALTADWSRAATWYRLGVSRGSTASAALLAALHVMGKPVGIDAAEAARLLRMAMTRSAAGNPRTNNAPVDLNRLYEAGRGMEGDAMEWFASDSVAAWTRNDTFAQFRMGRRYEMGWGTWPDTARALNYYRAGARGGDVFHRAAVDRLRK